MNKITCNGYVYTDETADQDEKDILAGSVFRGNSLNAEELTIDTFDATLNVDDALLVDNDGYELHTADDEPILISNPISDYKYGDVIQYEHDGTTIIKAYLEKQPSRIGATKYDFPSFSAIGILDNRRHYGGMYSEVPAGTIIAELMGDIPYTIQPDVAASPVTNWLPVASCRENLHQVLFVIGAGVFKDDNGDIVIKFIEAAIPVAIDDDRIYIDGSIEPKTPCTRVDVTEHSWFVTPEDRTVTLLDTSLSVTSQAVLFDNPCHDLVASGLTIEESGVNYAIVSGAGTLQGKEYTHTKTVLSFDTGIAGPENIVTVTNATLVSAFNSYNVALRVGQYYSEVATINAALVLGEERPALEVSFTNPFGEAETGYIKSLDIGNISATLKADAEIAKGFLPVGHGDNYNNYVVLTDIGNWTIPEDVTRIRLIEVEPGAQGVSGENGKNGSTGAPGAGGEPGEGGPGGRVLVMDLTVVPLSVKEYSCGEHTIFDGISAETGHAYGSGYVEPKSGLILGRKGDTGELAGGAGAGSSGVGPNVTKNETTYHPGANGSPASLGGVTAYGGYGGGAGSAGNGLAGQSGAVSKSGGYNYTYTFHGGGTWSGTMTGRSDFT
ncbi:hypothetical protein SAMN02745823_03880, partial [Sporobacter termitidis DSM 10068]